MAKKPAKSEQPKSPPPPVSPLVPDPAKSPLPIKRILESWDEERNPKK